MGLTAGRHVCNKTTHKTIVDSSLLYQGNTRRQWAGTECKGIYFGLSRQWCVLGANI